MALYAKVLTVSESVHAGTREDRSGAALAERLEAAGFDVIGRSVVPDGVQPVATASVEMCRGFAGLVVTTGVRDSLRATLRLKRPSRCSTGGRRHWLRPCSCRTPRAGSRGGRRAPRGALVINLPGSPTGALECLEAVLDVVPHALELMAAATRTEAWRSGVSWPGPSLRRR